jgi:hypothetical protein
MLLDDYGLIDDRHAVALVRRRLLATSPAGADAQ